MCLILDGKALAQEREKELEREVKELKNKGIFPKLCVILVGENPASISYVNMKNRACQRVGIESSILKFEEGIKENELINEIQKLNKAKSVNGILIQLPLPSHINTNAILESVDINKDVDGFHPANVGALHIGIEGAFAPATPLGIMQLLKHYKIDVKAKHVVIVGASNIVGKPLCALMLNAFATPSLCHIHTQDLKSHTLRADILCVGVGCVNLITKDMVKKGAVVVDIGINKVDGKIVGDCDLEAIKSIASAITPVPGGVGPMTISALLSNTLKATRIQMKGSK